MYVIFIHIRHIILYIHHISIHIRYITVHVWIIFIYVCIIFIHVWFIIIHVWIINHTYLAYHPYYLAYHGTCMVSSYICGYFKFMSGYHRTYYGVSSLLLALSHRLSSFRYGFLHSYCDCFCSYYGYLRTCMGPIRGSSPLPAPASFYIAAPRSTLFLHQRSPLQPDSLLPAPP